MNRLLQRIRHADGRMQRILGEKKQKSLRLTWAACGANFILGTGKMALGILFFSPFTCVSAFYTYSMMLAKLCALLGLDKSKRRQLAHYRVSALILLAASTLFSVYSASLIFSPKVSHYHFYIAIGIAAFTFTEIGLNLRGLLIERKNKSMLLYAVKMESLASSLICLVLTQKALLSFSYSGEQVALSKFHGAFGHSMGAIATLISLCMLHKGKTWRIWEEEHDSHSGC